MTGKETKSAGAKKPAPKKVAEKKDGASSAPGKKAPQRQVRRALKTQKRVVKGTHGTRVKKVRTSVQFRRPRTFRPERNPKYPKKAIPRRNRMDAYNIIKHPLTTESAMKKIEDNNTLVFVCNLKVRREGVACNVLVDFLKECVSSGQQAPDQVCCEEAVRHQRG